jgi:hypothetical protein
VNSRGKGGKAKGDAEDETKTADDEIVAAEDAESGELEQKEEEKKEAAAAPAAAGGDKDREFTNGGLVKGGLPIWLVFNT